MSNVSEPSVIFDKPQITLSGIGLAIVIGLAYSALYALLLINTGSIPSSGFVFNTAIRFSLKFALLLSCWWIIFRILHAYNDLIKLGVHLLLAALYAGIWYYSYSLAYVLYLGFELSRANTFIGFQLWIAFTALFEYAVVFAVLHILYSKRKLRQRDRQAAELKQAATRQQIASLKAQLNPHFLFNTLNSINAMGALDLDTSRRMVTQLSEMLRYSINSFEQEWVPLRKEIEFIRKYLELEKHRLNNRLEYTVSVDEHLLDTPISPMTIQPLVENAVRHGIAPLREGGAVNVSVTESGEFLQVEVADTGKGIPEDVNPLNTDGIGIRNTDQHLKKRYGAEHGLNIEPVEPRGTRVSFSIPLKD
jgi:sensor histidine kinase YesM